jgi:hypothetical protein
MIFVVTAGAGMWVRAAAALDGGDLLARIDRTWVDGESFYQVRIHEIEAVADPGGCGKGQHVRLKGAAGT